MLDYRYRKYDNKAKEGIKELDDLLQEERENKTAYKVRSEAINARRQKQAETKAADDAARSKYKSTRKGRRKVAREDIKAAHKTVNARKSRRKNFRDSMSSGGNRDLFQKFMDKFSGEQSLIQDRGDLRARQKDGTLFQKGVNGYKVGNMQNIGSLTLKDRQRIYKAHQNEAAKGVNLGQNTNPFRHDDYTMKTQNYSQKALNKMDKKLLNLSEQIINPKTDNDSIPRLQSVYDNIKNVREEMSEKLNYKGKPPEGVDPSDFKRSYRPKEGISGYGLGMNKFIEHSDSALIGRGLGFMTMAGAGESLMNSFGILTSTQSALHKKEANVLKRTFSNASMIRMGTIGSMLYSASVDQGLGGFVTDNLTYAAALQGWRVGTSFSPLAKHAANVVGNVAATPWRMAKAGDDMILGRSPNVKFWSPASTSKASRLAWGAAGGLTGAAIGALAVTAASAAISDITSNQSTIRKVAKNISTRTIYASTATNGATSSSRQAALNKLSRSGMNDRAMLYGNEARILGGII